MPNFILASASEIRADLLRRAAVEFRVETARVDEQTIKDSLVSEGVSARDIADALAEAKARKVAQKNPADMVLGCDQVGAFEDKLLSKPTSPQDALEHLMQMQGKTHRLLSAAVLYEQNKPIWRHVGVVKLTMRTATPDWLQGYVDRNWDSLQSSVGGYKIEEEGVRLFTKIEGDFFHVQGLPLLELLSYLTTRGSLPG